MARLAVILTYDFSFAADVDPDEIRRQLDGLDTPRNSVECKCEVGGVEVRRNKIHVKLHYSAETDEIRPEVAVGELRALAPALEDVASRQGRHAEFPLAHRRDLVELGRAMGRTRPRAEVRVPLLGTDHDQVRDDRSARSAVAAAVRGKYPFWSDEDERLAAAKIRLAGTAVVIAAPDAAAAVDIAAAYLTVGVRSPEGRALPLWAVVSAAIAVTSLALSFAPLTWAASAVLAGVTAVLATGAVALAPRAGGRRLVTFAGLTPILVFIAFACVYALIALVDPGTITLGQPPRQLHLREPLLLSLSLLSTVGAFDLQLHHWVRSIAYAEMLLVAALAGGAAVIAARRISGRFDGVIEAVERDRGGGNRRLG